MHGLLFRRAALFQHRPDQIDTPARRVILVAGQHIGRTGRGAEAIMHASLQNAVGFRDLRLRELGGRKIGAHSGALSPSCLAASRLDANPAKRLG
jgi:hypothetical protein